MKCWSNKWPHFGNFGTFTKKTKSETAFLPIQKAFFPIQKAFFLKGFLDIFMLSSNQWRKPCSSDGSLKIFHGRHLQFVICYWNSLQKEKESRHVATTCQLQSGTWVRIWLENQNLISHEAQAGLPFSNLTCRFIAGWRNPSCPVRCGLLRL